MKLDQMALHVEEADEGRFLWRILGCAAGYPRFDDVVQVASISFDDAPSAMRSGYKAMLAMAQTSHAESTHGKEELDFSVS